MITISPSITFFKCKDLASWTDHFMPHEMVFDNNENTADLHWEITVGRRYQDGFLLEM